MKRLLIALGVVASFVAQAEPKWVRTKYISITPTVIFSHLIDINSIQKTENISKFWMQLDDGSGKPLFSKQEFDCKLLLRRPVENFYYENNTVKDRKFFPDRYWIPIDFNDEGSKIDYKFVCL